MTNEEMERRIVANLFAAWLVLMVSIFVWAIWL